MLKTAVSYGTLKWQPGSKVWNSWTKIQVLMFRFPSHQMTPKILCICINSISPKENTFYGWEIRQLYYTTGARNFDRQNLALFWLLPCSGSIFFLGPESKYVRSNIALGQIFVSRKVCVYFKATLVSNLCFLVRS